ncbi:MAG: hypothetical protein ACAI44_02005 [Candidatus Sericytochromatia bacterium]
MANPPSILIYGFAPFRRYRRNVTQDIIESLPQRPNWHREVLPVRFEAGLFLPLLENLQPEYVLGLGQCPRGEQLRIERRGHNHMRENKADPLAPIDPAGPDHLAPNWTIGANSQRRLSYDAGSYVCNYSIYLLGRHAAERGAKYAFLHIPRNYPVKVGLRHIVQLLEETERVNS